MRILTTIEVTSITGGLNLVEFANTPISEMTISEFFEGTVYLTEVIDRSDEASKQEVLTAFPWMQIYY